MPFVPVPNVVEVNINQRLHGQQVQNTLYGFRGATWDLTNMEILAGEIITWVGTALYTVLSTDISLASVSVRSLNVQSGLVFEAVPSVTVNGDSPSAALPGNVALVASFRSGFAGRSRRGRNYVAGIPEPAVLGNTAQTTFADALRVAYEALIPPGGPFEAVDASWVVVSRFADGAPRAFGLVTEITTVLVEPTVDSQRRRLTGRGI